MSETGLVPQAREQILPVLYPLCISIITVGAELRVSVLCAYTGILPTLSVAGVPTTPESCQILTRELCFHVISVLWLW